VDWVVQHPRLSLSHAEPPSCFVAKAIHWLRNSSRPRQNDIVFHTFDYPLMYLVQIQIFITNFHQCLASGHGVDPRVSFIFIFIFLEIRHIFTMTDL
jgi:hypothetical protein